MKKYLTLLLITLFIFTHAKAQFENDTPTEELGRAVLVGDIDAMKDAIKKGGDVNGKHNDGVPFLIRAAEGLFLGETQPDAVEIVKFLLDKGANVNAEDNDGKTALFAICSGEDYLPMQQKLKIAEMLINKGANKEVIAKTQGNYKGKGTPLIYASMHGDIEMVKFLISKGANVNAKNEDGYTPLMLVADNENGLPIYNKVKIIELLLAKGAMPNQKNERDETAISIAEETGQTDVVKALKAQKVLVKEPILTVVKEGNVEYTISPNTQLFDAIKEGNVDAVKQAIKNGADMNVNKELYGSPLTLACTPPSDFIFGCAKNNYEIAELLIANGADVNYSVPLFGFGMEYNGALAFATESAAGLYYKQKYFQTKVERDYKEFIKIMELLLKKGAMPDGIKFNEVMKTPIMLAADNGCMEAVQLLLKYGASVKDPPNFVMGLMNYAAGGSILWTYAMTVKVGKMQTDQGIGDNPADKEEKEKIKKLLEKNIALADEYTEIVRVLIAKGANVNVKCKGVTPLIQAKSMNITAMINLLKKAGAK
ncbi:MAG TPA: ankyrin repeat domain-containing protein [Chitinophagaceae bacterium]|nr:ankyrin repeat domain-containing protein [Chitinophagaceae bacterium]